MCVIVSLSHQETTIQIPHISCNKHTSVDWGHNNGRSHRKIRDYVGKIFKRFHILWIPTWRWKFNEIGLTWLQDVCDKSCLRRRTTFKNGWKLGWQTELVVLRSPAADDRAIPTLRSDWSSHFLLASHWSGQSGLLLQVGKIITTETLTKLVWQLVRSQWEGDVRKRTNLFWPVWTWGWGCQWSRREAKSKHGRLPQLSWLFPRRWSSFVSTCNPQMSKSVRIRRKLIWM